MREEISNGCGALYWDKEGGGLLQQVDAGEGGGNGKEGRGSAGLGVHAASIFKLFQSFF